MLPELRNDGNETIGVFSDYGGEHSGSRYQTYSVLVYGWNHASSFEDMIEEVRSRHGVNNTTEMSYKSLRFGPLKRCLPEYLKTCSLIAGMLFTVIVDKNVTSVLGPRNREQYDGLASILSSNGFGKYKPHTAEKVLRVIHISAYLVALLSKRGQKVFWMSDNDAIISNEERTLLAAKLFQNILPIYSSHSYGEFFYSAPHLMDNPRTFSNFLSVADLAAGALEGYLTRKMKNQLNELKPEAKTIMSWLGRAGIGLKKHTMLIELDGDQLTCSELRFSSDKHSEPSIFIPVLIKSE